MIQANNVIAQQFAKQGVQYVFGIVGIPVIELGYAFQAAGLEYYGFRNEQGASYGCGAIGYLTRKPAICLVVSGPGLVHALAGAANAQVNGWPMIIVAGSSETSQQAQGGFQEFDQWNAVKPYVKFAAKITDARLAPPLIEKAVRLSMVGRPGCTYIEVPGDMLRSSVPENELSPSLVFDVSQIPRCLASQESLAQATALLKSAKQPLVIFGKGAAMTRAESQIRTLVDQTRLPFLPTPMGKGVVPDSHVLNVSAARSAALKEADTVLLVGCRLNWILHFGLPPRFKPDVKIIQIDIDPQEFNTNKQTVSLMGDIALVVNQLEEGLRGWSFAGTAWMEKLQKKKAENLKINEELKRDTSLPLQYYSSLGIINQYLPKNSVYVGEGSNTMDIGRTVIEHEEPRLKLDSGSFATMGLGIPFAIASKIIYRDKQVFAIVGDSAFGFSGMEVETATRYGLPIVVIIINNNGIFMGVEELSQENKSIPVTALNPTTQYEKLGEAFGAKGISVTTHEELHKAMKEITSNPSQSYVVNVHISPFGQKKPQEHAWLTQSKL